MPNDPLPAPPARDPAAFDLATIARNESWWRELAAHYPAQADGLVNLEHGYFGAMAMPVQAAYEQGIRHVNTHLSPFVRGSFIPERVEPLRAALADLIHAKSGEILLTRSASESMQVLIGQYRHLQPGDTVLWSSLDYPALRHAMRWLQQRRGVNTVELQIDLPIGEAALKTLYARAIDETPGLKLILLSQVYPANGQLSPVRDIIARARARGIDVLLDSAHALGQIDLDVRELDVDFAGFNLHKWIGAPLGIGFTYIRASRLEAIEPHFGDQSFPESDIRCRLYAGTPNIGAILAVPAALDFHRRLGGAPVKGARLRYLSEYWKRRASAIPGVNMMTPLEADQGTALAAFTIEGMTAGQAQQALLQRFNIFTVVRHTGKTEIVRATVALTTTLEELDRLVEALIVLAAETHAA